MAFEPRRTTMPRKRHKPEEIVAKLRQVDVLVSQGQSVAEAVRSIGVTEVTYYRWRQEFGGLKSDQVKRLKDLETENTRLRRAIADLTLDKLILRDERPCRRSADQRDGSTASFSSSSRLAPNSCAMAVTPVTFAPGRARVSASPPAMGFPVVAMTMGIVPVACLAARAPAFDPATMTSTFWRTSSAARPGRWSILPSAYRSSKTMFRPSIQPRSLSPW